MRAALLALAAIALAIACVAGPRPRPRLEEVPIGLAPSPPSSAEPGNVAGASFAIASRRVSLQFLPMRAVVRGTVGGLSTFMLVDTGASRHYLEVWFAKRIVLFRNGRAVRVEDAASHSFVTNGVDRPDVAIDGWGRLGKEQELLTSDVDYAGEARGIGVLLSPQRLLEGDGEAIVLDFPGQEMRLATFSEAEARYGNPTFSGRMTSCGTYAVGMVVEGRSAQLMLDTGADTLVYAGLPAGQALMGRSQPSHHSYGVGGPMTTRLVSGAQLKLGRRELRLDVRLVEARAPGCSGEGLLGMDALRGCVLVLGTSRMLARCE